MTSGFEASSLAKCVAYVLGISPHDVPRDGDVALGQWLARRNLGLVPVESAENFAWPGHFLGRRRGSRTWAVLFGVPPGVVFEPEPPAAPEAFDAAFVLAAHDPKRESDANKRVEPSRTGTIELIAISAEAERPMMTVRSAEALPAAGCGETATSAGPGPSRTRADAATTSHSSRPRRWKSWPRAAWRSRRPKRGATSSCGASRSTSS